MDRRTAVLVKFIGGLTAAALVLAFFGWFAESGVGGRATLAVSASALIDGGLVGLNDGRALFIEGGVVGCSC